MHVISTLDAAFLLVGAIIKEAIQDSFSTDQGVRRKARYFIFSNQIKRFLVRFHVDGMVNVRKIREGIKNGKSCHTPFPVLEIDE